ncbi:DUF882 domain-containing protein [Vibrio tapetis]|uniref:Murein endopeptidase K n=1 Tax=Vibrio tapetis subsp. tapetis TaxID=1671868 RepID=A0A2N8Z8T0_9VIBR|nr:DUF882 domain-containing protein [Vibrio tapetis]SON48328.1 conserved hypothetical protein [Vibrio tapetis subsp. tapetis]
MSYSDLNRRKFIQLASAGFVTTTLMPTQALASLASKPRNIVFNNLHTGEKIETCYFDGSTYVTEELDRINHICRDFRRNESHPMDKLLLDKISAIQSALGTNAEVQIISGYRSPATNEMLRGKSSGVAKKSHHMLGKAIDFRLEGVALADVRKAAISLKAGGVGYYPGSNFIHIDTGATRSW